MKDKVIMIKVIYKIIGIFFSFGALETSKIEIKANTKINMKNPHDPTKDKGRHIKSKTKAVRTLTIIFLPVDALILFASTK